MEQCKYQLQGTIHNTSYKERCKIPVQFKYTTNRNNTKKSVTGDNISILIAGSNAKIPVTGYNANILITGNNTNIPVTANNTKYQIQGTIQKCN